MDVNTSNSVTSAGGATGAAAAIGGGSSKQQDQFLKLLITQLKNQDPLNPLDSAQMTTQMAQMSTLQGIEKLNATLSSLASNLTGNQAMQASSLIGRDVMAPGDQIQLANGVGAGAVSLPQAVDQLKVTITDASGTVVHTATLGAQPQGLVQITWDGTSDKGTPAAEGAYRFSVTASAQGKSVTAQALMVGRVQSVASDGGDTLLNLGALGRVSLSQVQQFL